MGIFDPVLLDIGMVLPLFITSPSSPEWEWEGRAAFECRE